ncbi:MAG: bifunctional oligoribonuclease/PAP phosphatase NrnA [Candidatus Cryptobacteroides sp.]
MTAPDKSDLASFVEMTSSAAVISITSHIRPDGDAVGSSVAMLHFLLRQGKDARVILPHRVPETVGFLLEDVPEGRVIIHEDTPEEALSAIRGSDLLISMDYNDFKRTEALKDALEGSEAGKILIDHHLDPDRSRFSLVFSETETSSTCELLFNILKAMPQTKGDASNLPAECAVALMTGMTTDTNNFANSVYPGTLLMASELLAAGVDRDRILGHIYRSDREERLRLKGKLLYESLRITPDGVAYIILDRKTIDRYGVKEGETEGFVNEPLSIRDVRMSIFLKEDNGKFRVSIRSKKGVSANLCARLHFNGGGHELASGGNLPIPQTVKNAEEAARYIEETTHIFLNEENEIQ